MRLARNLTFWPWTRQRQYTHRSTGWVAIKWPSTKITISVQRKNIFAQNFPRSFDARYFISMLFVIFVLEHFFRFTILFRLSTEPLPVTSVFAASLHSCCCCCIAASVAADAIDNISLSCIHYQINTGSNYTVFQKKLVHQSHIDNLVNSQRIFKKFFTDTLCRKFAIKLSLKKFHHTLNASLHYFVKHECYKLTCWDVNYQRPCVSHTATVVREIT